MSPEQPSFEDLIPLLSPYGRGFLSGEWGRGIETYLERINYIGLDHRGDVLDAGGGVGQWAAALALTNRRVEVVDLMPERLLVGRELVSRMGITNVQFQYASIESLPYADESFDAVICYSVMMVARGEKTMREFYRVLRPNGRLYVMVDLWRWYLHMFSQPGQRRSGIRFLMKKLLGRGAEFYGVGTLGRLARLTGFEVISEDEEGRSSFLSDPSPPAGQLSFYPAYGSGRERLWEICAIRRSRM
jgi:SAM-dependent methyltransferase